MNNDSKRPEKRAFSIFGKNLVLPFFDFDQASSRLRTTKPISMRRIFEGDFPNEMTMTILEDYGVRNDLSIPKFELVFETPVWTGHRIFLNFSLSHVDFSAEQLSKEAKEEENPLLPVVSPIPLNEEFTNWPERYAAFFLRHCTVEQLWREKNHDTYVSITLLRELSWSDHDEDRAFSAFRSIVQTVLSASRNPFIREDRPERSTYPRRFTGISAVSLASWCLATGRFPVNKEFLAKKISIAKGQ